MAEPRSAPVASDGGQEAAKEAKPQPPAQFPPPVARTIDWLQRSFGDWYKRNPPPMPDRFTRREFGFILWPDKPGPPPFVRHRAYGTAARLHNYMGWKGPHSAYYSTAYYRRPGEMKMVDKQWLAAELIFDLDADHLAEAEAAKARGEEMPIQDQLRIVKSQFVKLLDEFLFGDLGISEDDVWITFSGGRGYHAHVTDSRLMSLDAKARREIVDYVTGKFPASRGSDKPDLTAYIQASSEYGIVRPAFHTGVRREVGRRVQTWRLPPPDAPGWGGRLTRSVQDVLEAEVLQANEDQARKWLIALPGVGKTTADKFLSGLNDAKVAAFHRGIINLDSGGIFDGIVARALQGFALPNAKGETDEPVTADIKRLIRLPGSLHGKSGLNVVTLTRDTLDVFDPFQDAVAFGMDPIRFTPRVDNELVLGGERVRVEAGQETDVPMAHAVWWCARQQGTVATNG